MIRSFAWIDGLGFMIYGLCDRGYILRNWIIFLSSISLAFVYAFVLLLLIC